VNALDLDTVSAPDGTVTVRLPVSGRTRVHLKMTWQPDEADRKAIFAELRRRANPDVLYILEEDGEDAIQNPEVLLSYGALADDPVERPHQLPFEAREPVQ
jgi:hypothetical protein